MASSNSDGHSIDDSAYQTPLGKQDPAQTQAFWNRFLEASGRDRDLVVPLAFCFGDTVELVDELTALVLAGTKRATAGSIAEYEADGEPVAQVGDLSIVLDGAMQPRMVIETTDIRVGPLSSVDDQFAWDEGEGDRSRDFWLTAHHWYFRRSYDRLSLEFHDDIAVAFERFEVIYQED